MHTPRVMWIERKSEEGGLVGPARIGRVAPSRSGRSLRYRGMEFRSLKGAGFKANYVEVASGERYWISGCRKDGRDALYTTSVVVDEDVLQEYWEEIRQLPERREVREFVAEGRY